MFFDRRQNRQSQSRRTGALDPTTAALHAPCPPGNTGVGRGRGQGETPAAADAVGTPRQTSPGWPRGRCTRGAPAGLKGVPTLPLGLLTLLPVRCGLAQPPKDAGQTPAHCSAPGPACQGRGCPGCGRRESLCGFSLKDSTLPSQGTRLRRHSMLRVSAFPTDNVRRGQELTWQNTLLQTHVRGSQTLATTHSYPAAPRTEQKSWLKKKERQKDETRSTRQ